MGTEHPAAILRAHPHEALSLECIGRYMGLEQPYHPAVKLRVGRELERNYRALWLDRGMFAATPYHQYYEDHRPFMAAHEIAAWRAYHVVSPDAPCGLVDANPTPHILTTGTLVGVV